MNRHIDRSGELVRWGCHAGDVAFEIAAAPAWLDAQRGFLSGFLTAPPGELDLATFSLRAHTDESAFHQIMQTITRAPISFCEPVPGLMMRQSADPTGRRCYVVANDDVEHRPGAYAVAVSGHHIELFTHPGTARPHRYPIRLMREAMLRTYEDAGGVVFHAAGVEVGDTGVMICGPRSAGKTTVTATLLQMPAAALLSNDRLVIHHREHVVSVPLPVPTGRGTIEAFPELGDVHAATGPAWDPTSAHFGSTVKHAFTARQFAEAFHAGLVSSARLGLVVVPRLTDTDEPGRLRRLSETQAREVITASCFTPRDEFWVRPWLVPRRRSDEQLADQADAAIAQIAASVTCVEVRFGVRNPISDLARILEAATGGSR